MLLDIEMEPPSGLEAAKQLMTLPEPPVVIFITKSSAYALKGYGLKSVRKCVDKYHGDMTISKDENIFELSARLDLPPV